MNISSVVMEAALVAFRDQAMLPGTIHEYNLRAALEAALPLVATQAWDEGFKQGGPMHDVNYDDPDAHTRNPYRSGT